LRVTVLGFAGAAPLEGACSSYVVTDADATVLLDCGPGTLERLWRMELLERLDAVVISHMHADHVLDLVLMAGELCRGMLRERPALYVPRGGRQVLADLDRVFSGTAARASRFDEAFVLSEYEADDRLRVGELELSFAETAHRGLCCAVRVSDGRTALVYGADGAASTAVEALARGADLLILEATYPDDRGLAAAQGHMTALQAGELAARAGARGLWLTHLLPGNQARSLELAAQAFDGDLGLACASEGLTLELA